MTKARYHTTPLDILWRAIGLAGLDCYGYRDKNKEPGTIIMKLSEEERRILKELTSEDTQKMQGPDYYNGKK